MRFVSTAAQIGRGQAARQWEEEKVAEMELDFLSASVQQLDQRLHA